MLHTTKRTIALIMAAFCMALCAMAANTPAPASNTPPTAKTPTLSMEDKFSAVYLQHKLDNATAVLKDSAPYKAYQKAQTDLDSATAALKEAETYKAYIKAQVDLNTKIASITPDGYTITETAEGITLTPKPKPDSAPATK